MLQIQTKDNTHETPAQPALAVTVARARGPCAPQASSSMGSMLVQGISSQPPCTSSFSCESTHTAHGVGPWRSAQRAVAGTGRRPWHGASRHRAQRGVGAVWSWREWYIHTCACLQLRDLRGAAAEGLDLAVAPRDDLDEGQYLDTQAWQGRKAAESDGRKAAESATVGAARPSTRGSVIGAQWPGFSPGVEPPGAARHRPEEAQAPSSGAGKLAV